MDGIWIILFAVLAVNLVVLGIWFDRKACQECKACIACPTCTQQPPCATTLADQPLAVGTKGTYIADTTNLSRTNPILEMTFKFNYGAVLNGVLFAIIGGTTSIVLRLVRTRVPGVSVAAYNYKIEYTRNTPSDPNTSAGQYKHAIDITTRYNALLSGWHTVIFEIDVPGKRYKATIGSEGGTYHSDVNMPDNAFADARQIYFGGRGALSAAGDASFGYINAAIKDIKVNDVPVKSLEYAIST